MLDIVKYVRMAFYGAGRQNQNQKMKNKTVVGKNNRNTPVFISRYFLLKIIRIHLMVD
jgi:murein L,D-transpeptidase YcbB/YkuD